MAPRILFGVPRGRLVDSHRSLRMAPPLLIIATIALLLVLAVLSTATASSRDALSASPSWPSTSVLDSKIDQDNEVTKSQVPEQQLSLAFQAVLSPANNRLINQHVGMLYQSEG